MRARVRRLGSNRRQERDVARSTRPHHAILIPDQSISDETAAEIGHAVRFGGAYLVGAGVVPVGDIQRGDRNYPRRALQVGDNSAKPGCPMAVDKMAWNLSLTKLIIGSTDRKFAVIFNSPSSPMAVRAPPARRHLAVPMDLHWPDDSRSVPLDVE
jgi:hypothetical protein